jgi:hypothetical protein
MVEYLERKKFYNQNEDIEKKKKESIIKVRDY